MYIQYIHRLHKLPLYRSGTLPNLDIRTVRNMLEHNTLNLLHKYRNNILL
jgi:hypothetical protein